jgi:hypothetical protein
VTIVGALLLLLCGLIVLLATGSGPNGLDGISKLFALVSGGVGILLVASGGVARWGTLVHQ